jgi:phage shock protein PspC (stress-responsive transcriptional regulator)
MTSTPPEAPPPPPPAAGDPGPRVTGDQVRDLGRLRRSRTDRKVAGVAGGLARHLDVDPLILRVAFVVLAFFGGAGLIVYGACWLLVPEDGDDKAPFNLDERSRSIALMIVGVLAALALVGDSWGAFWFPWPVAIVALVALWVLTRGNHNQGPAAPAAPPADQPYTYTTYAPPVGQQATGWVGQPAVTVPPPPEQTAHRTEPVQPFQSYVRPQNPRKRGPILFWFTLALVALAEGVLGIIDLAGAPVADPAYPALAVGIAGLMLVVGAFFGRAGGLIALGLVAAIALAGATAAQEVDPDTVTERPATAADVDSSYSLGVGEQRIDLSEVADPENLDGRTIDVEGDLGAIDITLPEGVRAVIDARVHGVGEIKLFGAEHNGLDVRDQQTVGSAGDPTITLDIELGVGAIEVTH